jgi:hypothetical protein
MNEQPAAAERVKTAWASKDYETTAEFTKGVEGISNPRP